MTVKIYKTASSVNEGSTTTFYATGFGATDKTFTYTLSNGANGTVAGFADVKGATASTGTVNISNGVATIPLTLLADLTTEGTSGYETLTLSYGANAVTNSLGVAILSAASSAAVAFCSVSMLPCVPINGARINVVCAESSGMSPVSSKPRIGNCVAALAAPGVAACASAAVGHQASKASAVSAGATQRAREEEWSQRELGICVTTISGTYWSQCPVRSTR